MPVYNCWFIKCWFIKFMVDNFRSKTFFISLIAKVCSKHISTTSGCTVSKILNEYDVDCIKLDTPHGIKDKMALQYGKMIVLKGRSGKLIWLQRF